MTITFFSLCAFVQLKATTAVDYAIGFYGSITMLCSLALLMISVWQMENVIKLIERSEKLIELSKLETKLKKKYGKFCYFTFNVPLFRFH